MNDKDFMALAINAVEASKASQLPSDIVFGLAILFEDMFNAGRNATAGPSFDAGFDAGRDEGRVYGYDDGYEEGYQDGNNDLGDELTEAGESLLSGGEELLATPKLKVGDRVRLLEDNSIGGERYGVKGDIGIIEKFDDDGDAAVLFDKDG